MDKKFKFAINVLAYQLSINYMTSWQGQNLLIDRYWYKLLDSIDFDELEQFFNKCCTEENLRPDYYNLNQALISAQNEWRVEMMTATTNHIAYDFANFDVPYNSTLVKWNYDLHVMEFIDYSLFLEIIHKYITQTIVSFFIMNNSKEFFKRYYSNPRNPGHLLVL